MCCVRTTLANRAFSSLPWEGSGLLAAWDALWARLGAARPRLLGFRQCILTNPVQYLGFVRSMRIDETEIAISAMGRPRDDLSHLRKGISWAARARPHIPRVRVAGFACPCRGMPCRGMPAVWPLLRRKAHGWARRGTTAGARRGGFGAPLDCERSSGPIASDM